MKRVRIMLCALMATLVLAQGASSQVPAVAQRAVGGRR
jgi:hypothetical protein